MRMEVVSSALSSTLLVQSLLDVLQSTFVGIPYSQFYLTVFLPSILIIPPVLVIASMDDACKKSTVCCMGPSKPTQVIIPSHSHAVHAGFPNGSVVWTGECGMHPNRYWSPLDIELYTPKPPPPPPPPIYRLERVFYDSPTGRRSRLVLVAWIQAPKGPANSLYDLYNGVFSRGLW